MTDTRPNILFILLDDLGWRDLGCMGSSFYETPNLDRLARQGMRFTDAYAASPVCSPTRASIMSGKYPARVGLTNYIGGNAAGRVCDAPYVDHLPTEETSLASALAAGGYATWHIGKWHLGERPYWPDQHGFAVNIGGCHWGMPKNGYFAPWGIDNLDDGPPGEYLTDRLGSEAVGLIRSRDHARPFFLHLALYAVHTPIQAKPGLAEKYRRKARMLGLDRIDPFEVGERYPCVHKQDERVVRRRLQSDPDYAAMVQSVDDTIGRVLAALDDEGIAEDTLVVFTSDNGGLATAEGSPTCNAPLNEGKGWMYEGGTREPLLVRWPGVVAPDSTCGEPVTSPDFYPTLLDAAGLPPRPQQHVDGVSLMPLLRDADAGLDRDALFWHFPHYGNQGSTPGCSIRQGDYKLIEFFEDDRCELYDLSTDIGEIHDLAAHCPQRVAAMRQRLRAWREEVAARVPVPNPDYEPWERRPRR